MINAVFAEGYNEAVKCMYEYCDLEDIKLQVNAKAAESILKLGLSPHVVKEWNHTRREPKTCWYREIMGHVRGVLWAHSHLGLETTCSEALRLRDLELRMTRLG